MTAPEPVEPDNAGCPDDTERPFEVLRHDDSPPDDVEPPFEEIEVSP